MHPWPGDDDEDEPSLFVAPYELAGGLPRLFWATILGPMLVDRFGRERVLATPARRIGEPAEDTIVIQLAEDDAAREAAERHLGEDAFYGDNPPEPQTPQQEPAEHHEYRGHRRRGAREARASIR